MKKVGRLFFISMLFLLLLSSRCEKNNECNYDLVIKNTSSYPIIYSNILYYGTYPDYECKLKKTAVIQPNNSFKENLGSCWEEELQNNFFDIYIVDLQGLDESGFIHCDSIFLLNNVLHYYHLDKSKIDSLKKVHWTLHYP